MRIEKYYRGYDQNRELLELLHYTARNKNATPAQISLVWMMKIKPTNNIR